MFSASAERGGSRSCTMPRLATGIPSTSRGMTFTALRTDSAGSAPCSCRSMAISQAELPKPTTSTFSPLYGAPLRYSALCRMRPPNCSIPSNRARNGFRVLPVAITTLCDVKLCSAVCVTQRRPSSATDRTRWLNSDFSRRGRGIGVEVAGNLIAARIFRERLRHRDEWQRRTRPRRVQVQPVVSVAPQMGRGARAVRARLRVRPSSCKTRAAASPPRWRR